MALDTRFPSPAALKRRLRLARFFTTLSIAAERLLPRLLPLLAVLAAFAIFSWFGVFRGAGDAGRMALLAILAVAGIASLWPLRSMRWPAAHEVDRRLEVSNHLAHAPITTQDDTLGSGDAFAETLWREHQRRMAESVSSVEGAQARTDIPKRDPYALRAAVALLLVTAFAFSFGGSGGSLTDAFRSHASAEVIPPRIDAWVTPPSYTGVPPIFLTSSQNQGKQSFQVPEGSIATVRIAGGTGSETVAWPAPESPLAEIVDEKKPEPAKSRRFELTMEEGGGLSIADDAETLMAWTFEVTPDEPPTINFNEDPTRAANGTMSVEYQAEDDYRVAKARGIIALADEQPENARPLYEAPELPLSVPRRSAEDGAAKTTKDLTEHPWAGARVDMTLEASDDREQTATSETRTFVLPGRPFSNPLARAVIEQRRNLALDANAVPEIVEILDVLMLYPEITIDNATHFLGLSTIENRVKRADGDEALRGVVDYMWEVARIIEDGNLSDAERRMRQAQQALQDALENGASDEEIEQLMAELREAMNEYLQELARQMQNDPNLAEQMPNENTQELNMQSLQEMLDQIEELAKSGSRQQAQDMLSQLQDMMNNLQMGQSQQQQGGQSQAQQQMNELGEILRQQQELMNETYRQNRRGQGEQQQGQGQQGQQQGQMGEQGQQQPGQGQQGQNGQGQMGQGQGLQGLAPGQQALRDRLDQFMEGLRGMGINPGDEFGQAGDSMGNAGDALQQGEGEQAFSDQGEAMEALRQGADSMMQQMQQAMQGGTGAGEPGGRRNGLDRDPLGRPQRSAGPDFGESVDVPDEIDIRRAREILDAIRKRLGNSLSPQLEKEYLERLLELN